MNLYEINNSVKIVADMLEEWAAEHEGDITDFPLVEEMEKIEMDRDEKCLSIGAYAKGIDAEAEAIKAEIQKLSARKSSLERKYDSLKRYVQGALPEGTKIKDSRVVISWRKSASVSIPPEITVEAVKTMYPQLVKTVEEISKTECKELLKNNTSIKVMTTSGIKEIIMQEKNNISIK